MASTFTTNTGIEKIGDGEQTGQWGQTTNVNFDIVDRALNGVLPIQLSSTAFTLTTSSGGLSDGQAAAVIFTGSIGGPATITIAPDTAQKTYVIRNGSNQPLTITQGSGGDVTIPVGSATVVACTGVGATSRVFEAGISQVNLATGVTGTLAIANGGTGTTSTQFASLTTNVTGTLPVANGGTGTTSTQFASLTTNVTGTLPVANGGTGTTSTQFASLTTNVTGTLPVANGGTGRSTITSGAIVLGNGTGQVGQLVGTSVGQVAQWNGSTWAVESLPAGGVTNVTASAPLASSGGGTPNLSLTGIVPIANGGTGTTSTQFANLTTNVTGTLPIANGGTGNGTGNAATATALQTARTINGVSFDGTANITLPGTGNAATATALQTARTIGGVSFNGTANINLPGVNTGGNQNTTGSAASLTTARTIGGVSFNGTANINLPGVNQAGNQNTTGSAATATLATSATALQTARTINGVSFNGTANITLPTVNTSGNQTIAGIKTFSSAVVLSTAGTATTQAVRADRAIATGTGILGGGNLTADRTLSIDIASQAEAEAGTDNAHVMTPLRVKQSVVANAPAEYTDAQARAAQAEHASGSVGSYIVAWNNITSNINQGGTIAGSNLRVNNSSTTAAFENPFEETINNLPPVALVGTWRALVFSRGTKSSQGDVTRYPSFFLRIS